MSTTYVDPALDEEVQEVRVVKTRKKKTKKRKHRRSRLAKWRRKTARRSKSLWRKTKKGTKKAAKKTGKALKTGAKATGRGMKKTGSALLRGTSWLLFAVIAVVGFAVSTVLGAVILLGYALLAGLSLVWTGLAYALGWISDVWFKYVHVTFAWLAKGRPGTLRRYRAKRVAKRNKKIWKRVEKTAETFDQTVEEIVAPDAVVVTETVTDVSDMVVHDTAHGDDFEVEIREPGTPGEAVIDYGTVVLGQWELPPPPEGMQWAYMEDAPEDPPYLIPAFETPAPESLEDKVKLRTQEDIDVTRHEHRNLTIGGVTPEDMYSAPGTEFNLTGPLADFIHEHPKVHMTSLNFHEFVDAPELYDLVEIMLETAKNSNQRQLEAYWNGRKAVLDMYPRYGDRVWQDEKATWALVYQKYNAQKHRYPINYMRVGFKDMIEEIQQHREALVDS